MSNYWRALCVAAKVSPIRLHDARHTCGTLMHLQVVPIVVVSAQLGHADPAFTMRTYVHSQDDALKIAAVSLQRVVSPSCQWRPESNMSSPAQKHAFAVRNVLLIEPPVRIELLERCWSGC
jgi:Phage integrase family